MFRNSSDGAWREWMRRRELAQLAASHGGLMRMFQHPETVARPVGGGMPDGHETARFSFHGVPPQPKRQLRLVAGTAWPPNQSTQSEDHTLAVIDKYSRRLNERAAQGKPLARNLSVEALRAMPRDDVELRLAVERELPGIESKLRSFVNYGRHLGLSTAAANLERFLDGTGGTAHYDPRWLRSQSAVGAAEESIRRYFADWIAGKRLSKSPVRQLADELGSLVDGGSAHRFETWQAKPAPSIWHDPDLKLAIGRSYIDGIGDMTFTKRGNKVYFDGIVRNDWRDRYDWERGQTAAFPGAHFPVVSIPHDLPLALQELGRARPFDMRSAWRQYVSGALQLGTGGPVLESIRWTDDSLTRAMK